MRLVLVVWLVLVLAPDAWAGGWSTVGLSSTPEGVAPGRPWDVEMTVLAHGVNPLSGLEPTLRISDGVTSRTFAATAAGKPGVYRARVVFPSPGTWRYSVVDGYIKGVTHTFPAADIRPAAPAPAPLH